MATEGKIKKYDTKRREGTVVVDDGSATEYSFHLDKNESWQPQKEQRVSFQMAIGARNVAFAKDVKPLEQPIGEENEPVVSPPEPFQPSHSSVFLNPYNFVRFGKGFKNRKPYVSHIAGCDETTYSGRLKCALKPYAPIFVPDAGKNERNAQGHTKMVFFKDSSDKLAIPGSSIKGMLRSVAEAFSNSCLSQLASHDKGRLDYRSTRVTPQLRQGIILRVPQKEGDFGFLVELDGKNLDEGWDSWVESWRVEELEDTRAYQISIPHRARTVRDGNKVYSFKRATEIGEEVTSSATDDTSYQAFLKKTGATIRNKHDERLFYSEKAKVELVDALSNLKGNLENLRENLNDSELNPHGLHLVEFTYIDAQDYNSILDKQRERKEERDEQEVEEQQGAYQFHQLREGDLVYWRKVGHSSAVVERANVKDQKQHDMSVVLVPRLRYLTSIRDLLPEALRPCNSLNGLCPCCRLFGTVGDTSQDKDEQAKEALAGRIRISNATIKSGNANQRLDFLILGELGAPHPTAIPFYLKSAGATNHSVNGYDEEGVELRGRKFYLHAPEGLRDEDKFYIRDAGQPNPRIQRNKRNKTVQALLPSSDGMGSPVRESDRTEFQFTVDFTNLTSYEVGLLCYALELEDGLFHHLGMGKPLGLGTVKIEIDKTNSQSLHNAARQDRYRSFTPTHTGAFDASLYISDFKTAQVSNELAQGDEAQFNEIDYVKDLHYVLSRRPAVDANAAIKYPHRRIQRPDGSIKEEGGYVWFKQNKRPDHYEETLPTLEEIEEDNKLTGWS